MHPDAWICDVDGVLLASPHERAWRDALRGIADPGRLTTATCQADVDGRSRQDGARAALVAMGVPMTGHVAPVWAAAKRRCPEDIVATEGLFAFPDALRIIRALKSGGRPLAAAS